MCVSAEILSAVALSPTQARYTRAQSVPTLVAQLQSQTPSPCEGFLALHSLPVSRPGHALSEGSVLDHQHGSSPYLAAAQRFQGLVRPFEGEGRHLRADRHPRGELEELFAVPAGEVRDRAHGALSPQ
jgi:hypothetical protein